MRVTVVIPALNEAGNIGRLVEETYAAVPVSFLVLVFVVFFSFFLADSGRH